MQNQLYKADQVGWLATARLLMGYPLYLLAIVVTVLIVGSANGMTLPSARNMLGARKATGAGQADLQRTDSPEHTN